jgi:hypothetical protein
MLPRRASVSSAVVAVCVCVALVLTPVALAVFTDPASGGPFTVSSATLSPATKLAVAQPNCRSGKGVELGLTWTATSSSYATSYAVERATSASGPFTLVASLPSTQAAYTDSSGSLAYSTTYYYRVSAVYRSWTAASTVSSIKTLNKFCL